MDEQQAVDDQAPHRQAEDQQRVGKADFQHLGRLIPGDQLHRRLQLGFGQEIILCHDQKVNPVCQRCRQCQPPDSLLLHRDKPEVQQHIRDDHRRHGRVAQLFLPLQLDVGRDLLAQQLRDQAEGVAEDIGPQRFTQLRVRAEQVRDGPGEGEAGRRQKRPDQDRQRHPQRADPPRPVDFAAAQIAAAQHRHAAQQHRAHCLQDTQHGVVQADDAHR